jgi:NAD+ synthase (glutamine-hydrolysing)
LFADSARVRDGVPFNSIYAHGYARVAVCTPRVAVADVARNLAETVELASKAEEAGAVLAVFPELGLSAYSIDDLLFQDALLDAVERALGELVRASASLRPMLAVGAPLRTEGKLFNCAAVVHRGRLLGVVPKTYLPNYREFYEERHFAAAGEAVSQSIRIAGDTVPFGNDLLFAAADYPDFTLHVEICEDVWTPISPSTYAALGGATVLANLSASNATIGKSSYRRLLCESQSAKCVAAYVYSAAGFGESTTDLAWDGDALIHENGELLASSERFRSESSLIMADVDLERLRQERMRMTSFTDCAAAHRERLTGLHRIELSLGVPAGELPLARSVPRFPYVPADPATLDARCYDAYNIQVQGLMRRLSATGIEKVVIGVSGGLDSTHALLVCAQVMDRLELPRANILAYRLPGFATSAAARERAQRLIRAIGASGGEIDIRPSARQMLADIDHPYARGEPVYDVTFENVQAGERTSHLFRLANRHRALVVGTSDLSELALGYTTYGVGDQMAHYGVNASVPKSLIQHLVRWMIATGHAGAETIEVLRAIVDAEFSAELVPGKDGRGPLTAEQIVGPYELQDFNLFYLSRYGFRPSKVAFLAHHAWGDPARGAWPRTIPDARRPAYDLKTIKKWLDVFLLRFFEQSQFKRSAMPNAPKVGSGGSLSPRADWRAPSDASAAVWLEELRTQVPD